MDIRSHFFLLFRSTIYIDADSFASAPPGIALAPLLVYASVPLHLRTSVNRRNSTTERLHVSNLEKRGAATCG